MCKHGLFRGEGAICDLVRGAAGLVDRVVRQLVKHERVGRRCQRCSGGGEDSCGSGEGDAVDGIPASVIELIAGLDALRLGVINRAQSGIVQLAGGEERPRDWVDRIGFDAVCRVKRASVSFQSTHAGL